MITSDKVVFCFRDRRITQKVSTNFDEIVDEVGSDMCWQQS